MAMVTGGQLVARMLKKEGVRHIFTLSGLHVAPIYAGCVEEGIQVIDTRHEQAAAHAADAYARITRGVGVAVVTAGPGVTDALTGVANAYAASSPMILLGGAAPIFNQSRGCAAGDGAGGPLPPHLQVVGPRAHRRSWCRSYLAKAFRVALSGRPGPVFLELAWDVLCNGVDESALQIPRRYRTDARLAPDPRKVDEAMALLAAAERPAIIAGSSRVLGRRLGRAAALRGDARRSPCTSTARGAAACRPSHPLFFQHTRKEALSGADLVFVIGTPFDFRLNYGAEPTFSAESKIVQVDIDPDRDGAQPRGGRGHHRGQLQRARGLRGRGAEGAARTRSSSSCASRETEEARGDLEEWTQERQRAHPPLPAGEGDVATWPTRPAQDPVFIADGGNWVAMAAKVIELQRAGPLAGPGAARAAWAWVRRSRSPSKVLHPERTHLGDPGGRLVRPQRLRLRDRASASSCPWCAWWGTTRPGGRSACRRCEMFGEDKSPATLLAPTRYDKVVEAFGGHGEHVTEPAQIRPGARARAGERAPWPA